MACELARFTRASKWPADTLAHSLREPDNGGSGVFWTVGRNEMVAAECDAAYDVVMSCPRGVPVSVRWTKVGASDGLGSGTVDGVSEAGCKREMEPQWNEATMAASSRHELERPLWEEATTTAPADVEGCESELSRSVKCSKGFLREPD